MARYETRVVGTDEVWTDDIERMAVNRFCEILGQDTTEAHPRFPLGSEVICLDLRDGRELLRYVVGYE